MQPFIGVVLGALATFVLLVFFNGPDGPRIVSDATQAYLVSVIVGAIVSLAWPWVIGLIFVRRAKARRDADIQKEVSRQVSEQSKRP
jgi:uncharacterized membrane protein (DUF485 family)